MSQFLLQLVWFGRLGNRMHQYAYGATYARLTDFEFWLPSDWEGTRLFKRQIHRVVDNDDIRLALTPLSHSSIRTVTRAETLANNQQRMQAVQKYYPDAELIDADHAPDPYLKPGHPICNASGCFF